MDVGVAVAGGLCVALALGHTTVGVVWVLPALEEDHLPETPFGPRSTTLAMIRVTWSIVTVFVLALGGLFLHLSVDTGGDAQVLLLRWFAAMWAAATAMAWAVARLRPRALMRLPVPLLWIAVAALCWEATT